jgi:hypothetical protein
VECAIERGDVERLREGYFLGGELVGPEAGHGEGLGDAGEG